MNMINLQNMNIEIKVNFIKLLRDYIIQGLQNNVSSDIVKQITGEVLKKFKDEIQDLAKNQDELDDLYHSGNMYCHIIRGRLYHEKDLLVLEQNILCHLAVQIKILNIKSAYEGTISNLTYLESRETYDSFYAKFHGLILRGVLRNDDYKSEIKLISFVTNKIFTIIKKNYSLEMPLIEYNIIKDITRKVLTDYEVNLRKIVHSKDDIYYLDQSDNLYIKIITDLLNKKNVSILQQNILWHVSTQIYMFSLGSESNYKGYHRVYAAFKRFLKTKRLTKVTTSTIMRRIFKL